MPGPLPKDPTLRQRRNKASGSATLSTQDGVKRRVPPLPKIVIEQSFEEGQDTLLPEGQEKATRVYVWHPLTKAWWKDVWHSPMAGEYVKSDIHALYRLAYLIDRFWREGTKELAAEIRLQQQSFGLTPIDRRRLQWEIEKSEEATTRRQRRRPASSEPVEDPRKALRVVGSSS